MATGKIDRDNGIAIGIVDDLGDPENLGRIKVKLQHLAEESSDWAWLVSPMAGQKRGLFLRPEVGDQVLVAFLHGDPHFPYILGSLWSKQDPPPPDDGDAKKNNWRFIKSRCGHIVKLDDTNGAEKIEITDHTGQLKMELDSAKKKISVENNGGDIEISGTTGNVSITTSSGQVKIQGLSVDITAQSNLTLKANGVLTIQGSLVKIN